MHAHNDTAIAACIYLLIIFFQKLDLNGDGVVSMDEFLQVCQADETIYHSVNAFTNSVI